MGLCSLAAGIKICVPRSVLSALFSKNAVVDVKDERHDSSESGSQLWALKYRWYVLKTAAGRWRVALTAKSAQRLAETLSEGCNKYRRVNRIIVIVSLNSHFELWPCAVLSKVPIFVVVRLLHILDYFLTFFSAGCGCAGTSCAFSF